MNTAWIQIEKHLLSLRTDPSIEVSKAEDNSFSVVCTESSENKILEFLQTLEDQKKFLFHGTPNSEKFNTLHAMQGVNPSHDHGNLNAVYATSIFREAIYYASINKEYLKGGVDSMSFGIGVVHRLDAKGFPIERVDIVLQFEDSAKALFLRGGVEVFKEGILYVLDTEGFEREREGSSEFHSERPVNPLCAITITRDLAKCAHEENLKEGNVKIIGIEEK